MTNAKANQVIGANLRMHRKAAQISQEQMGKVLGIHQAAVCRVERGSQSLTPFQLVRAAGVMKINVSQLLGGIK